MIKDGVLVYGAVEQTLNSWEITNQFLNAFTVAALSTVISYQGIEVLFDVFLGLKPRWTFHISDLYIFLLIRQSPLWAILSSLFPSSFFTRKKFNIKSSSVAKSMSTSASKATRLLPAFKLVVLLSVAPIINIIAVILTLEKTTDLTITEAKFGGIALGVNGDFSILEQEQLSENCSRTPMQVSRGEQSLVEFNICLENTDRFLSTLNPGEAWIRLSTYSNTSVSVEVIAGQNASARNTLGTLYVNETSYYSRVVISDEMVVKFRVLAMNLLAGECGLSDGSLAFETTNRSKTVGTQYIHWRYDFRNCIPRDEESATRVASRLIQLFTFIDAENVDLLRTPNTSEGRVTDVSPEFEDGSGHLLLRRRRRTLSLFNLLALAASICMLRILVACFTRNNLDLAIEMIIKDAIGLHFCDSMLRIDGYELVYNAEEAPGRLSLQTPKLGDNAVSS